MLSESYISTGTLSGVPTAQIWHGGTVSVPEPTSAMLMLFGAAFLGLKRKNRRIA
ncbi:MAG: PEP-CTERM sorting domain-containing protein [Kiritimatiellae bacterium]|nr:PEP-CTERM sorting domain-containing protein [Kiritimatiellia bacterium]